MGLKHGPKAIGEVFEEFALFLYLGPRMGLTRVMRWPKNTSYNRHLVYSFTIVGYDVTVTIEFFPHIIVL